jgi:tetratricopeptide (TPR) repeat protein
MRVLIVLFLAVLVSSCSKPKSETQNPSWAGKMQSTAQSFQELLPFIYNEDKFNAEKNSSLIEQKITNYAKSIHKIDKKQAEGFLGDDPYVAQSMTSLQDLTRRSLHSFKRGDRKNSRILLKATTNTCFKCHTRQNAGPQSAYWKNFNVEQVETNKIEKAHILVSMRQYEEAKLYLKEFLKESENRGQFDIPYENALHHYLMISLRGQNTFQSAQDFLRAKILVVKTPTELHYTLKHWAKDLKYWSQRKESLKPNLAMAQKVLARNKTRYSQRNLVNNLVATSLLHEYLMQKPQGMDKARAYRLLGRAYDELVIEGYWNLPEVYYEMCINHAPGSNDAKRCFRSLKENVTVGYSGSRGTMVPSQEYKRLDRLRKKAGL